MVEEGIFKCPNCLEEKLIWFTNWQMKIINNEEKWIFYRHCENIKEKHICWAIERGCTQTLATIEEFWDRTNGATEEEWNKNFNFYCKKCNYKTKNFKEFIPKFNKSNKDS